MQGGFKTYHATSLFPLYKYIYRTGNGERNNQISVRGIPGQLLVGAHDAGGVGHLAVGEQFAWRGDGRGGVETALI